MSLKDLEKQREHHFPLWNRYGALRLADQLTQMAQRWSKAWAGVGGDEDLEMALQTVQRASRYVDYLYQSYLYRKLQIPEALPRLQDRLMGMYGELSTTKFRRVNPMTGFRTPKTRDRY